MASQRPSMRVEVFADHRQLASSSVQCHRMIRFVHKHLGMALMLRGGRVAALPVDEDDDDGAMSATTALYEGLASHAGAAVDSAGLGAAAASGATADSDSNTWWVLQACSVRGGPVYASTWYYLRHAASGAYLAAHITRADVAAVCVDPNEEASRDSDSSDSDASSDAGGVLLPGVRVTRPKEFNYGLRVVSSLQDAARVQLIPPGRHHDEFATGSLRPHELCRIRIAGSNVVADAAAGNDSCACVCGVCVRGRYCWGIADSHTHTLPHRHVSYHSDEASMQIEYDGLIHAHPPQAGSGRLASIHVSDTFNASDVFEVCVPLCPPPVGIATCLSHTVCSQSWRQVSLVPLDSSMQLTHLSALGEIVRRRFVNRYVSRVREPGESDRAIVHRALQQLRLFVSAADVFTPDTRCHTHSLTHTHTLPLSHT